MKGVLFTFALTFGGAFGSLIRPYTGFLIYTAFAILRPQALWWYILPSWQYSRIIAVGLLLGWALHGLGSWYFGRARGIVVALMLCWAWLALGTFFHRFPDLGWVELEARSKVFLAFLIGITLIDSMSKLKQLVWVIVLSQGYLAIEFHQWYYGPNFDANEFTFLGSLDRNGIAITMCTSIGMAFFLGLHAEKWWQKVVAFAAAALMAHVVLFSLSRGGMLALVITGLVSFFLIKKKPVHYLLFAVAVLALLRMAGTQVRDRFFSTTEASELDGSAQSRLMQWERMIEVMKERPLIGVGARFWMYHTQMTLGYRQDGHSTWLQVGAEQGIPALIFLVTFYALGLKRLWPLCREKQAVCDPWVTYLSRMVFASLIGFIVSAQFVTVDAIELPYYVMLVGAGVLKVQSLAAAAQTEPEMGLESPVEHAWGTPALAEAITRTGPARSARFWGPIPGDKA
jgi:probable O-glycosylation ligase (exosortase A-associated)